MNEYNIIIDIVGALVVGVIMIAERKQSRQKMRHYSHILMKLMLCCTMIFLSDIPGLLLDGITFPGASVIIYFFDVSYWVLQIIYCWLWLVLADFWSFTPNDRNKRHAKLYAIPMVMELIVLIANYFTGWVFSLDAHNVYGRGDYFTLNMVPYIIYIVAALLVTFVGYKKAKTAAQKRRCLSLAAYMFLPICGVIIETKSYGMSWIWPFTALSLLMVYLNVQQQYSADEQVAAANLESELTQSRMAIMLSQIQPHFLYNSLCVIQDLCHGKAPEAEQATIEFSEFLRGNLDSLTADRPVSFAQEMKHVRNYLALEKKRFGDRLIVEYDIKSDLFRLPALSLQPIVENAVHYGVMKRDEGGTVKIAVRETENAYVITVTDNGIGFDPEHPAKDGRNHVGIANVRDRLHRMSGGTLTLNSTIGTGTTATITIPKGGSANVQENTQRG